MQNCSALFKFLLPCRYGSTSVEYGHDLMKFADVAMAQVEEWCQTHLEEGGTGAGGGGGGKPKLATLCEEARRSLGEAERIFAAHYGEEDARCAEAREKMAQMQL